MNAAFHFDTLVWDWPIAIYLLLIGISSGMIIIAVLLKRQILVVNAVNDSIIRATTIIAPLAVTLGLVILIFHLARPWTFWYLMVFYNPHSVMSLGVMLFQIYMLMLILWIIAIYQEKITDIIHPAWVSRLVRLIAGWERGLDGIMVFLAVLLGVYTGFLLLALKSYPLLNNPVLPLLFLASGLTSAVAMAIFCGLVFYKQSVHSPSLAFIHRLELPLIMIELGLLAVFFIGLIFSGGQKEVAALTSLRGFWGAVFWLGIVGLGILLPIALTLLCSERIKFNKAYLVTMSGIGLCSVLMLRMFILYAGQMVMA
ncbi:cytochrome c nitrite reductase subunit NrfD [Acerihabitans arboris]|uniref:Cytochrome c nitrite reductase subunit NrfD n=1 Tax=Acerihabitans arboris TaxID=2691583 RepID=A0A845SBF2_9GAMM|nr:cytochrome c nitrite reductase subunit NrfD [Acerihabitans arboris]NDL62070.1 cytochrome c nitrite reductase subunit NrfD [Acerihabitans arboris]